MMANLQYIISMLPSSKFLDLESSFAMCDGDKPNRTKKNKITIQYPTKMPRNNSVPNEQAKGLLTLIGQVDQHLANQCVARRKVVLIVGNTGAGKSTFVNYMLGCKMFSYIDERYGDEVVDCENPYAPIGHGKESKTFLTTLYTDEETNLTYVDCPGFGDNRGVEMNIANMYSIAQLLHQAQKLQCVVFVVNSASLDADRGNSIREAIETLKVIFGETHWRQDSVLSHILLLVTGAPTRNSIAQLRNKLHDIVRKDSLLPVSLVDSAEAYDPLDLNSARHFLHRSELQARIMSLPGIFISGLHDGFALASESMLSFNRLLEDMAAQSMDLFRSKKFEELKKLLQMFDRLRVLSSTVVDEKFLSLVDRLRTEVSNLASDDSAIPVLQSITNQLPVLADVATDAKEKISLRLQEKKRLSDEAEAAKNAAKEESNRRRESDRLLKQEQEKHAEEVKKLTEQINSVRIELDSSKKAATETRGELDRLNRELQSERQRPMPAPAPVSFSFGGYAPPQPSYYAPPSPFSTSSFSSASSSGQRAPTSWNAFQHSVKGQGFTKSQISQMYQAQKRR